MLGDCVNCSINFYKNVTGNADRCKPCPSNAVTTQNGSTLCGKLQLFPCQYCIHLCHFVLKPLSYVYIILVCDHGAFRENGVCGLCANGTYKNVTGDHKCSACEDGTITMQEGTLQCGIYQRQCDNTYCEKISNKSVCY